MHEDRLINALRWIIDILNDKNIPYQISGGFAAHVYGSTRPVNDIDIDVPEDRLAEISELVGPYVTHPLGRYKDGKWDLEILTLMYQGQEIDIGGAYASKISTLDRTEWVSLGFDLEAARSFDVEGITVKVAPPEVMIAYKRHLDGDHQLEDIVVMKKYVRSEPLFKSL